MTMKVNKCLEFSVVALPGVGHMSARCEDVQDAARVFYLAATRATLRLVIGLDRNGGFCNRPTAPKRLSRLSLRVQCLSESIFEDHP
jgi:superfamily I DNA/RNA helicase